MAINGRYEVEEDQQLKIGLNRKSLFIDSFKINNIKSLNIDFGKDSFCELTVKIVVRKNLMFTDD